MISKTFQNILTQMTEVFPKRFGIADSQGLILASHGAEPSSDLIDDLIYAIPNNDTVFFKHGYTVRAISTKPHPEFIVYVEGTDDVSRYCCCAIAVAASNVRYYYDEKYDKTSFMQNIIFDNLLPFDLHQKAKELHVDINTPRAVFYIKVLEKGEKGIFEVVSNMFPDKEKDFIINIDADNLVLIKEMRETSTSADLDVIAHDIADMLSSETMTQVLIGIGTISENINNLNNSYKESQIAIEVGKVFDEEKYILNYDNLGIGRLIYQLPIKLCKLFLKEVFKKGDITSLDEETILTINKFFENDLNVSETSRQLFVHRNTLVYRLEKIYKLTGLDLRKFDQAIVFKVAMMVHKYLISNPMKI
ncbi:MAG: helix-turn-helix domain-containing protein [Oscillospiraceae bacterium]|nr:helix-turn-helix domain-containing protein [Oscillospiraceae bacterium]